MFNNIYNGTYKTVVVRVSYF